MEQQQQTQNEIVKNLKLIGVTCNSCWWREGDRCYLEPCEREPSGRSTKMALEVCAGHKSKRSVLANVFPNDMLVIASEKGKPNQPY